MSRKESRETRFWLRLTIASGMATEQELSWELDECQQLLNMIRRAIITAQSDGNRGDSETCPSALTSVR